MSRVYADFNNVDPAGRVRLSTQGTMADVLGHKLVLADGDVLTIYCDDLEATGVVRQLGEGGWGLEIDWRCVRDRE